MERVHTEIGVASGSAGGHRRIAVVCAAGAGLLGIAGLAGWVLGLPALTQMAPAYRAIAPSAAASLVILGFILLRLAIGALRGMGLAAGVAAAGLVSLLGLLEIVGFGLGIDLNLEDAATRYLARVSSIPFHPMSPAAGPLLFLLAAALVALLLKPKAGALGRNLGDWAGILGVLGAVGALVFTLGYLYNVPLLYGTAVIPIAATAAIGCLLLGVGTVAVAGADHWPLRAVVGPSARARLLRAFVPLTVFVVVASLLAHDRITAFERVSGAFQASVLGIVFGVLAGVLVSRVAQSIGETIDQAHRAQQRAEQALADSERHYRMLVEASPVGIFYCDRDSNCLSYNEHWRAIVGVAPGNAAGVNWLSQVHPEDRQRVTARWRDAAAVGGPFEEESRFTRHDGGVTWVLCRALPDRDPAGDLIGYIGTITDITIRKQAERERDRNAKLVQAILENTRSHLVYLDRDFNFVFVNPTYARTCGYAPHEMIGLNHFALYPHAENEAIFRRVRDTGQPAVYYEKPFEFPDQPERGVTYWDWTLTPVMGEGGEVEGLVFSLDDVTDKVRAREQMVAVERARAELAETMAAEVSHRVKNNLAIVAGLLQMQIMDRRLETQAAALVRDAVARLTAISAVHEQLQGVQSDHVDLRGALDRIVAACREALVADDTDVLVTGDPSPYPSKAATNLCIVANELITNAIKYGDAQDDGRRRIEVGIARRDSTLVLTVWNSGNPVPEDLDIAAHARTGLALVRGVADLYGGSFTIVPERGGTLARVTLDEARLSEETG